MLSILGNRKIIVSILTMVFLIVGVQGISYGQAELSLSASTPTFALPGNRAVVDPGGEFTISVSVTNSGNQPSTVTALIFYNNGTATTTTGGVAVGAAVVPAINAGASANVMSSPLTAPATMGTYNYYASVLSGDDAANNTSNAAPLTVQVTPKPNLQVINLYSYTGTVDPVTGVYNAVVSGTGSFTLQADVRNIGDANFTGQAVNLQYHVSPTRLTSAVPGWTPIGSVSITSAIAAGALRRVSINLPAPFGVNTLGIYYYYVRVAPAEGVSDPANNTGIHIGIRTASADLLFDTVTVDKSTLDPSESFTLTVPVRNQGPGPSSANTTLQYYRSTDSTLDRTTDTSVGTVTIGVLSGTAFQGVTGTTRTETVTLTAPDTPGTYYYGAYVSDPANEPNSNIGNNYSNAVAVTVSAPPDLVAELFQPRQNTVAPGERLTLEAAVTNNGAGQSSTTTLRLYESEDRRLGGAEEIRRVFVDVLDSNSRRTESIPMTAPTIPGTYYYHVRVVEVENEEVTANNTSSYIVLYVEAPLVMESVQASKSTLAPRERFTLTATLRNDGRTTSDRTTVTFYSSADDSISSRDTAIGSNFVSPIAARGTGQVSRTLTAPTVGGTYYYGVCVGDDVGSDVCMVTEISVIEVSIANLQRPPMYWVDADEGTLHSLTDSEIDPFASGARNASSIAIDMSGGKVYWTEQTGTSTGRIRRANLNSSNVETVRALNNVPYGIAVDASNGKLYVTNSRGKIQRFNLDGSNFESNFIINLDSPGGIAVDAAGGKVYWTDQTSEDTGRLQRADLDGSNVETIRMLNNVPYGIAVDALNEKLYVTNSRGKIQRFNLDGSNFEWNFITNLDSPQGIAVDVAAGKIYWTEAGSIRRANLNGSNIQDVATGIGSPTGIALRVAPVNNAPTAPGAVAGAVGATALHANYPNPFNPETWIPYQLQHGADVQISIHSQSGVLVRELSLGYQEAGPYMSRSRAAYWDGRNELGEPVASGLYFYTLTAGDFSATRRMLILK